MKITQVEVNVLTGEQIVKEVELTEAEVLEMERNQKVSEIQNRMNEILQLLKETDYKAIKFAEGIYTEEEYAETKLARQKLREEYNNLEKQLAA